MNQSPIASNKPSNWNVPNVLSTVRFVLALVVCSLVEWSFFFAAMICFIVAASTDWIDGWWARRYNQVTKLGRILDPFVDKIIICGAMVALAGFPDSPLRPWMATLVVGRELLVTSLRGMVEGQGGDFSAKQLGKWKMLLQCVAVVAVMLLLHWRPVSSGFYWFTIVSIYSAMALTVISGLEYVWIVLRNRNS
jgi:CDP-diacylglycerol--glycerol-3-phosphate 3-phosphatidyltransferase